MRSIVFFLLIVVVTIVVIYFLNSTNHKDKSTKKTEHFEKIIEFDSIDSIKNNKEVLNYLNRNTIYELKSKTGSDMNDKNKLINMYFGQITKFNSSDKQILSKHINNIISNKTLNKHNLTSIISQTDFNICEKWNLIKIENTLEFGYPYTLGKFIFIPEKLIKDDNILTKILVHEKLHIIQRYNKKYYYSLYNKLYGKYMFKIDPRNVDISDLEHIWITNPDSNDELWLIKDQNNLYIVPYINKETYVDTNYAYKVIEINNSFKILDEKVNKKLLDINILFSGNSNINYTHPNETYVDQFLIEIF
jgi:hypothetical protein